MMPNCFLLVILFVGGFALPAPKDDSSGDDLTVFFDHSRTNIDGRIIGGTVAGEGTYPWMVALTTGFMTNIFLCGGALITTRDALTAAHCVDAMLGSGDATNARIIVGTNSWDDGGTRYSLRMVGRIPEYDAINRKNDIGILRTAREIVLTERVKPIDISYDLISGGIPVRVSGWGWLQTGGTMSDVLQEIRLLTLDGESCVSEVRRVAQSLGMAVPRVNPDVEICTFLTGNEGTCTGDGGSPLVRNSNNQLIGVASWGVPCARGAPDVFTRVGNYRTWIETVLSIPIPGDLFNEL